MCPVYWCQTVCFWHKSPKGFVIVCYLSLPAWDTRMIFRWSGSYLVFKRKYTHMRVKSWHFSNPGLYFLFWSCSFVVLALCFCQCSIQIYTFDVKEKFQLAGFPQEFDLLSSICRFLTARGCHHISQLGLCWFCQTKCFVALLKSSVKV